MKEIRLKIVGKHIHNGQEEDQLEFITEGKMYEREGVFYLTYDESEMSGLEGSKTRLCIDGDTVKMTRVNKGVNMDTEMFFSKGERYTGLYDTPYGPVEMEVLTNSLENSVNKIGEGKVSIDYSISLKGLSEGRSKLSIEVI